MLAARRPVLFKLGDHRPGHSVVGGRGRRRPPALPGPPRPARCVLHRRGREARAKASHDSPAAPTAGARGTGPACWQVREGDVTQPSRCAARHGAAPRGERSKRSTATGWLEAVRTSSPLPATSLDRARAAVPLYFTSSENRTGGSAARNRGILSPRRRARSCSRLLLGHCKNKQKGENPIAPFAVVRAPFLGTSN